MQAGLATPRRAARCSTHCQSRGWRRVPGSRVGASVLELAKRTRRGGGVPVDRRGWPGPRRRVEDAGRTTACYDLADQPNTVSSPEDLIFDALTFPLSTGDDGSASAMLIATIEAIQAGIKAEFPMELPPFSAISNVSFGLNPVARKVTELGLPPRVSRTLGSMRQLSTPARIEPLHLIPDRTTTAGGSVSISFYDRRTPGYDPLGALLLAISN